MTLPVEKQDRFTIEEYLRFEEKAVDKHEYRDGEILAMSGGTYKHSRVATNLLVALATQLKDKPCFPLESNMRVRIHSKPVYFYPDATIVCGEPQFDSADPKQTTILNPRVVFEVLSDSTAADDRGEKFEDYRSIPSMDEYVLLSQDRCQIDAFLRQGDGTWSMASWTGIAAVAKVRCLSLDLPLSEVYSGLALAAE